MKETCTQKHLGMLLDFRLDFQEHWKSLLKKVHKTVAILRKFQNVLPGPVLLTTYKCFVKTHLNYGDIVYDQTFNNSFHQKIESLQLTQFYLSQLTFGQHNITQLYLSQMPLEDRQGKKVIKNYAYRVKKPRQKI